MYMPEEYPLTGAPTNSLSSAKPTFPSPRSRIWRFVSPSMMPSMTTFSRPEMSGRKLATSSIAIMPAAPLNHEDTKRHEEHETLLYKMVLRDLRDSSCLRDKPLIQTRYTASANESRSRSNNQTPARNSTADAPPVASSH